MKKNKYELVPNTKEQCEECIFGFIDDDCLTAGSKCTKMNSHWKLKPENNVQEKEN